MVTTLMRSRGKKDKAKSGWPEAMVSAEQETLQERSVKGAMEIASTAR
jgi:hypothetical protein